MRCRPARRAARPGRFPVQHGDHHERHGINAGRHEKRVSQAEHGRQHAADDRSNRRSHALGRLHRPDRERHLLARRRRAAIESVSGPYPAKKPWMDAKREEVPRLRDIGHGRHHRDEADERPLHEQLVAEAVADAAPERRRERGNGGRHAERHAGPERDLADVGDAELADVERQERHHQREAGKAHEGRGGDGGLITLPGVHEPVPLRTESSRPSMDSTWMLSTKRIWCGCVCITSDVVRVPSPKKRTPRISVAVGHARRRQR